MFKYNMFYIDTLHEVLQYGLKTGGFRCSDNVMSFKFRKSNKNTFM